MFSLRAMQKKKLMISQLLNIYKSVIEQGRFQRKKAMLLCKLRPEICEGRWYSEIKRYNHYGAVHNWRTMLMALIQVYTSQEIDKAQFISFLNSLWAFIQTKKEINSIAET